MDPSVVIEGKITSISGEITSPNGNFKSKTLWIIRPHETNHAWDNHYDIQVRTDRYALLEKFREGAMVKATVNLSGRKYQKPGAEFPVGYKTLSLYKLESINAATEEFHPEQSSHPQTSGPDEEADLPF